MIELILHPSDLSVGSEAAFLARTSTIAAKSSFCILHSQALADAEETDWSSFRRARRHGSFAARRTGQAVIRNVLIPIGRAMFAKGM